MIDILENNINNFDINNKNSNTIICSIDQLEESYIFSSLTPLQKSTIHLNVKIFSDKDIEKFIFFEYANDFKSVNLIISSNFDLSKIACKKLEQIININSVLKYTEDNKIKGCSFKNYFLTSAINNNSDTHLLLSNETIETLNNNSQRNNDNILFYDISSLSKELLEFLKFKNFNLVSIKLDSEKTLTFELHLLYTIFERIDNYTTSLNINIENTLKFNIIYKKLLKDIDTDYKNYMRIKNENLNTENKFYYLYNDLSFSGYHYIMYQTLKNHDINTNLILGKIRRTNTPTYFLQVNFDKYWFNCDIVWNHSHLENEEFLKSDKEFFKTHYTNCRTIEKCTISFKKFNRKYKLLNLIKNKILVIFRKNDKEFLQLPAPTSSFNKKNNSIFENL